MSNIRYEQMICTSSQKSIVSGMPGFGVRTKSSGISDADAEELFAKSGINYRLPMEMMITEEEIIADPDVEKNYPCLYTFRKVESMSGNTFYIIARTLYVGLDYGYFAEMDGARRAGTNYIAHLLVFSELPSFTAVASAVCGNYFMPSDTRCTPRNSEMRSLLTGEPVPLLPGSIEEVAPVVQQTREAVWMTIALLQAYKNRKMADGTPVRIIFKVNHRNIPLLLNHIAALPPKMRGELFFQANGLLSSGVPDGLEMVLLNEKNTTRTDDDYYITVDVLNEDVFRTNIEENYLFGRLVECGERGDTEMMKNIVSLFLNLDFSRNIDYEFIYKLLLLAVSEQELSVLQIDLQTLRKILSVRLSADEEAKVWAKINRAVNNAFVFPAGKEWKTDEVSFALEAVALLRKEAPERLVLSVDSCRSLTQLLFGEEGMLPKVLADVPQRLDGAIYMVGKVRDSLPQEEGIFRGLGASTEQEHWKAFLYLYYGTALGQNLDTVVRRIESSGIADKAGLAARLYPVEIYCGQWLNLLETNPVYAKCFGSVVSDYWVRCADTDSQWVIECLLGMNSVTANSFDANFFAEKYVRYLYEKPEKVDAGLIKRILQSDLNLRKSLRYSLERLLAVSEEIPLEDVDAKLMFTALRISKNYRYLMTLFSSWVKQVPDMEEVNRWIAAMAPGEDELAQILDMLWKQIPQNERKNYVLGVIDRIRLSKEAWERLQKRIADTELSKILMEENAVSHKLIRKANLFFKNMVKKK